MERQSKERKTKKRNYVIYIIRIVRLEWEREGQIILIRVLRVFGFYIFVVSFVIKTNISNWVNILPTTNVISSYFCPPFFLLILNIPYFLFKNLIFASKAAYIKGNIVLADMKRWDCKIPSGQWAFAGT